MKKPLRVLLWLAVFVASGNSAIAHKCHSEPQYSVGEGNHTHTPGTCDVKPLIERPDSRERDRSAPAEQKERRIGPPGKEPLR